MTSKKVINIDDSIDKPGSRSNPYIIERDYRDRLEIKARHLMGDVRDFEPGGRFNPYVIEKSGEIGEKEILVPKYYTSRW